VTAVFEIGKEKKIVASGPDDRATVFLSIPAVRLAPGESLAVALWDREVFNSELMGKASVVYRGTFPLVAKSDAATADCRLVPSDLQKDLADRHLSELDQALAGFEARFKADPMLPDWGYPQQAAEVARRAGELAGAYLGYAAMAPQLERFEALGEAWSAAKKQALTPLLANLPKRGEPVMLGALKVRVAALSCDGRPVPAGKTARKPRKCQLVVELANETAAVAAMPVWARWNSPDPGDLVLEDLSGFPLEGETGLEKELAPGKTRKIELEMKCSPLENCTLAGAAPIALRIIVSGVPQYLNLQ
jgi:hypothetical protein